MSNNTNSIESNIKRYNGTKFPSCYVTVLDDKIHMVFKTLDRAKVHLKVCDGKCYGQKCNEIWEKAIVP